MISLTDGQLIDVAERALGPLDRWAGQCHAASLAIVKAKVLHGARVARGSCTGVGAQHSWVVLGDPYDPSVPIVDPTLWSYDDAVEGVWVGSAADGRHRPHGAGNIWQWGRPAYPVGDPVRLRPVSPFSDAAVRFLELLGPLDVDGWRQLAHAPVGGWPAGEILAAIEDTIGPVVPIDIIGMTTDRNPSGLYLPGPGTPR